MAGDVLEVMAWVVAAGLGVWGAWKLGVWADDHLTPEQKKELEREEWRHKR